MCVGLVSKITHGRVIEGERLFGWEGSVELLDCWESLRVPSSFLRRER